jgi:hypothetical protein
MSYFSYAGMIDKTVVVGASSTVNVILKRVKILDEVVVVAFGKQTAKSIVGSVVTIGKEVLGKQTSVLTSYKVL